MPASKPVVVAADQQPDARPAYQCPMVRFVDLVAGKWAVPVLYRLIVEDRPMRFSELQRAIAPITQKELTRHLRAFERNGLVTRQIHAEVPPRVEYRATELGRTLRDPLAGLAGWVEQYAHKLDGDA